MKKWQKILICSVAGVLVLAILGVAAAAGGILETGPAIKNYEPGHSVYMNIYVASSQMSSLGGYHVRLQYNADVLTYNNAMLKTNWGVVATGVLSSEQLNNGILVVNNRIDEIDTTKGYIDAVYINSSLGAAKKFSGQIGVLCFTVNNVTPGTYANAFTALESKQYDIDALSIDGMELGNGSITVEPSGSITKYGDINGDNAIGMADVTHALRAIALLNKLTPEQIVRGDVDGSGTFGMSDVTLILRWIAKLDDSFPVE